MRGGEEIYPCPRDTSCILLRESRRTSAAKPAPIARIKRARKRNKSLGLRGGEGEGRKVECATDGIHVLDEFILREPNAAHIAVILVIVTIPRKSQPILLVLNSTFRELDETPNGVSNLNTLQHLFGSLALKHFQ